MKESLSRRIESMPARKSGSIVIRGGSRLSISTSGVKNSEDQMKVIRKSPRINFDEKRKSSK